MSSLLSVLVTKDPVSSTVSFYKTDIKSVRNQLNQYDKGCTAFIETIADIDNAHFMTMFEMQAVVTKLMGMEFNYPPRDRLIAAKLLAEALSRKQKELPPVPVKEQGACAFRVCMPQQMITPCKKGTKLAILIECLLKGSTVPEMMKATGWAEGGVLSGINYDINKRKGCGYKVTKKDGQDFYQIVLPEGFAGQLII